MSDVTSRLREMHQRISTLQASLERHLSSSTNVAGALGDALAMYSLLTEDYIPKEESFLRSLERHLEGGEGALSVLFAEHEKILRILRGLITSLQEGVKRSTKKPEAGRLRLVNDLRAALDEHLSKEENVIFWLANLRMGEPGRLHLTRITK